MTSGLNPSRTRKPQRTTPRIMQPPQSPDGRDYAHITTAQVAGNALQLGFDRPVRLVGQPVLAPAPTPNGVYALFSGPVTSVAATQQSEVLVTLTFDGPLEIVNPEYQVWQPCNWLRTTSGGFAAIGTGKAV